jgi:Protein of unknown function (DUF3037)
MSAEIKFGYTVLRYVHDITTQEFVNVGVLIYAPENRILRLKCNPELRRVHSLFPSAEPKQLKTLLHQLQEAFDTYAARIAPGSREVSIPDEIMRAAAQVLPKDSSALQWASAGGGYAGSLDTAMEGLFARYVQHHEHVGHGGRRSGRSAVLNPFRKELKESGVLDYLKPRVLKGELESYQFPLSWKNRVYHCYEAVNLNLKKPAEVHARAFEWVGRALDLDHSKEKHSLHLLVAEPVLAELRPAYRDTCDALKKALPSSAEIVQQDKIEAFSREVANSVKKHIAEVAKQS